MEVNQNLDFLGESFSTRWYSVQFLYKYILRQLWLPHFYFSLNYGIYPGTQLALPLYSISILLLWQSVLKTLGEWPLHSLTTDQWELFSQCVSVGRHLVAMIRLLQVDNDFEAIESHVLNLSTVLFHVIGNHKDIVVIQSNCFLETDQTQPVFYAFFSLSLSLTLCAPIHTSDKCICVYDTNTHASLCSHVHAAINDKCAQRFIDPFKDFTSTSASRTRTERWIILYSAIEPYTICTLSISVIWSSKLHFSDENLSYIPESPIA